MTTLYIALAAFAYVALIAAVARLFRYSPGRDE